MSKNITAKAPVSGVTVGLHIDKNTYVSFPGTLLKVIIAALGSTGAVFCYFPVIMPHIQMPPVLLISAVICAACGGALYLGKRGNALIGGMYIALAAAVFKFRQVLAVGILSISNEFYSEIHIVKYPGAELHDLSAYTSEEMRNGIYTAIVFFTIALALVEGTFIVFRTAVVPAFLASFFPLEMSLYFGLVPNYFCAAAVLCCWAAAAAKEAAEIPVSGKTRRMSAYFSVSGQSAAALAAVTAFCIAAAWAGVRYSDFERTESLLRIRRDITGYVRTFSWDKFKNDISALNPVNPDISGATNHGRLGRTDEITFTEEDMLTVTLPKRYDNVYLKGFSGVTYTGNSWTETYEDEEESERLAEIISRFDTSGLQPMFFDGYILEENKGASSGGYSEKSIFVERKGANRNTAYLPYFVLPSSAERIAVAGDRPDPEISFPIGVFDISTMRQHLYLESNPFDNSSSAAEDALTVNYQLALSSSFAEAVMYIEPAFADIEYDDETMTELQKDELKYREFVYEEYLDIPDTFTAAEAIYGESEFTGIATEVYSIRDWLENNCSYDLSAGRLPFGKDFAQYFLTENRKGSCSHFATAAALMCRYRGIPARYIEGYVIKADDFPADKKTGENVTINLTDESAHAWIEVYLDGYGWMPFETTPGYESGYAGADFTLSGGSGNSFGIHAEEISPITTTAGSETETAEAAEDDDLWEDETEETDTETETVTEETETSEDGETDGNEETEENAGKSHSPAPVVTVIIVPVIIAAVFAVRYKNVTGARNRMLTGRNSRKKAKAAGRYFMELCRYKNIVKDNMSADQFGEYAEHSIAELRKGSAEIILNAALEADYAEANPSAETADSAAAAVIRFAGELYEDMKPGEKFVFKYLRCLK